METGKCKVQSGKLLLPIYLALYEEKLGKMNDESKYGIIKDNLGSL